jgi:hypothetical protein
MSTIDEIAISVNHALLKYNSYGIDKIYDRLEWLWRATTYLRVGIDLKKQIAENEEDRKKFEKALSKIDTDILPKLKMIYRDKKIPKLLYILLKNNPGAAVGLIEYSHMLNELRDTIVALSVATGFVIMKQLIFDNKIIRKRKSSPFQNDLSPVDF